jgi:predicted transcriptional regulator of viral defense system
MSTDRKTKKIGRSQTLHRFAQLAAMGESVFHISDLASLWQITDKNTLYTTLTRYTKQKLLYRLWRGMYALKPAQELNPLLLGIKAVHMYAYISTETILFRSGIISQRPEAITLVGPISSRFSLAGGEYICRKLADSYLYQPIGISEQNGVREASPERAAADLLYFNPRAHFDAPLDWKKIKRIQKAIGYPSTPLRYL